MFKINKKHYTEVLSLLQEAEQSSPANAWGIVKGHIEEECYLYYKQWI